MPKEKYERITTQFLKKCSLCQTRKDMLVNKLVNQNEVKDIIILISSHRPRVLMEISVTFILLSFSLFRSMCFIFSLLFSTTP